MPRDGNLKFNFSRNIFCGNPVIYINPKYKLLGLLSYPYWMFFEYYAPIIETIGILITILLVVLGIISWKFFFLFSFLVYLYAVMFSMIVLYVEEATFQRYVTLKDLRKFLVYAAIKGNWEKISANKSWGEMARTRFDQRPGKPDLINRLY